MPNRWRTVKSLVHKIRLHGRRGKGIAESFSREKLRHAPQKEGGWEILCDLPPVTPAGTSNELDVQNEWEENTPTLDVLNCNTVMILAKSLIIHTLCMYKHVSHYVMY